MYTLLEPSLKLDEYFGIEGRKFYKRVEIELMRKATDYNKKGGTIWGGPHLSCLLKMVVTLHKLEIFDPHDERIARMKLDDFLFHFFLQHYVNKRINKRGYL